MQIFLPATSHGDILSLTKPRHSLIFGTTKGINEKTIIKNKMLKILLLNSLNKLMKKQGTADTQKDTK